MVTQMVQPGWQSPCVKNEYQGDMDVGKYERRVNIIRLFCLATTLRYFYLLDLNAGMRNDEVCVKDGLTTLRSRNNTPEYIYILTSSHKL